MIDYSRFEVACRTCERPLLACPCGHYVHPEAGWCREPRPVRAWAWSTRGRLLRPTVPPYRSRRHAPPVRWGPTAEEVRSGLAARPVRDNTVRPDDWHSP